MAAETKTFTINFYTIQIGADDARDRLIPFIENYEHAEFPPKTSGGILYQIRDFENVGDHYRGVFGKYRSKDIPHISAPGEAEKDIDMEDNQGLLEKNYFLFYPRHHLLIYQVNSHASHQTRFSNYISLLLGVTSTLNPVLQKDAYQRLMRSNVKPKKMELSFARPTNSELYNEDDFSGHLMQLMRGTDGARIKVTLSAERNGNLSSKIKGYMLDLIDEVDVSVARLEVDEEGSTHPIDLICDRISSKEKVEMLGRYPMANDMYLCLERAYDEHLSQLIEIFGTT